MPLKIQPIPGGSWQALPHETSLGVYHKVLLSNENSQLTLLRFQLHATMYEHSAEHEIDVICLEGEGYTSVGDEKSRFRQGQYIHWPAGVPHRLWTKEHGMETLLVEHLS